MYINFLNIVFDRCIRHLRRKIQVNQWSVEGNNKEMVQYMCIQNEVSSVKAALRNHVKPIENNAREGMVEQHITTRSKE